MYPIQLFGMDFELCQQGLALLALVPIWLYRGRQGYHSKPFQYACYAFLPRAHAAAGSGAEFRESVKENGALKNILRVGRREEFPLKIAGVCGAIRNRSAGIKTAAKRCALAFFRKTDTCSQKVQPFEQKYYFFRVK